MTEQEFVAIGERWANVDYPPMALAEFIDVALDDILALLRMVEDRDAIIHDLMIDGAALARRAVEEFAAGLWDWVNIKRQRHQMTTDFDTGAACALGVVQSRIDELRASGTAPDPLPPAQVRQENDRLRSKLKAIFDQLDKIEKKMRSDGIWFVEYIVVSQLKGMAKEKQ